MTQQLKSPAGRKAELSDSDLFDAIIDAHADGIIDLMEVKLTSNEVRKLVFGNRLCHMRIKNSFERAKYTASKIWSGQLSITTLQNKLGEKEVSDLVSSFMIQINQLIEAVCQDSNYICEQLQAEQLKDKLQIKKLNAKISEFKSQIDTIPSTDASIIWLPV